MTAWVHCPICDDGWSGATRQEATERMEREHIPSHAQQNKDRAKRHGAVHPHGSPSHEEGAWCSMGPDSCGQFASVRQFDAVEGGRFYLIDGRGVPVVCYECRAVQGDVRQYPPVPVTMPHEHVAFYDHAAIHDLREQVADLAVEEPDPHALVYYERLLTQVELREALEAENTSLRVALAHAAIPLEVLNMDNGLGATWMTPELREEVAAAVAAIRKALTRD